MLESQPKSRKSVSWSRAVRVCLSSFVFVCSIGTSCRFIITYSSPKRYCQRFTVTRTTFLLYSTSLQQQLASQRSDAGSGRCRKRKGRFEASTRGWCRNGECKINSIALFFCFKRISMMKTSYNSINHTNLVSCHWEKIKIYNTCVFLCETVATWIESVSLRDRFSSKESVTLRDRFSSSLPVCSCQTLLRRKMWF